MAKYRVIYDVRLRGRAYVEAESSNEAKKKTRTALTPTLEGIVNDSLEHRESFHMRAEK